MPIGRESDYVTESSGRTADWTYDGIYRLTNETISLAPSGKNGSVGYGLDPVGNRTSATSTIPSFAPVSGTFNQDDELASEGYDANGNVTSAGGKTFSYDSQNQLVSMNGGAVQIIYDGDGNRVSKTVLTNGVPASTYYLVDDLNPTGYPQVVEELQGTIVTRQYTYGLQRIDENQFISSTWTPSFYGYDGGGNVRQLTNSAGTVTDTYEYDAYGNSFTVSGTTPNNYLYRGEQYDPDLGLYYLRARYYNPLTGRFMGRDPLDGQRVLPITLHKYLYAGGDPANLKDPTGRVGLVDFAKLLVKASSAVDYLNAISCGVGAGFTAGIWLADPSDLSNHPWANSFNGLAAAYGCVAIFWEPGSPASTWLKSGIDLAACAWAMGQAVSDENEYFEHPMEFNARKFGVDLSGGVFGCAVTEIGAALEK